MTDRTIVEAAKKEYCEALFAALGRFQRRPRPTTATWPWRWRCAAR